MEDICVHRILTAVVNQAVQDYRRCRKIVYKNENKNKRYYQAKRTVAEIEKFFSQEDFFLIYNLNGEAIFKKVKGDLDKSEKLYRNGQNRVRERDKKSC